MPFYGNNCLLQECNDFVCLYFSYSPIVCFVQLFSLGCDAYNVFMHCGTVIVLTNFGAPRRDNLSFFGVRIASTCQQCLLQRFYVIS